jgi:uncharacterized protein YegL
MARAEAAARGVAFFGVGVGDANMTILATITERTIKLNGLNFRDLFIWLSQSQRRVSASKPGEQTALPPITFGAPV